MALAVDLLEDSFDLVAPRGDELVELFYANLFASSGEIARLFDGVDMAQQKKMLLAALVSVRRSLRDIPSLVPTLEALGARHVRYGTLAEHYPLVGAALLAALETVAGDAWSPEVEQAWSDAYAAITEIMLGGAAAAGTAPAAG